MLSVTPPRGPHKERTEQTTAALVRAGRELFAADGYRATSLEAISSAAGVTKGALYHHFPDGKRELFAAVFAAEQRRLARTEQKAYAAAEDPWSGFRAGCLAFLRASADPGVRQITLLDAPGVLEDSELLRAQGDSARLLATGLRASMQRGTLAEGPIDTVAQLLHGMLCRAALIVARGGDGVTLADVSEGIVLVLDGLEQTGLRSN